MKKKIIIFTVLLAVLSTTASYLLFAMSIPYCDEDNEGELYPHPSDPTKYYQCVNGLAIEKDCPPGLHYNPGFKKCDYPENIPVISE